MFDASIPNHQDDADTLAVHLTGRCETSVVCVMARLVAAKP